MPRRRFTPDEEERGFEELAPKPYEYVPLPTGELPKDSPLQQHEGHSLEDRGRLSGQLQGLIVALTPIHVASGGIEMMAEIDAAQARETPLVRDFFRSGGQRVIPASSLKGAMRAIVEAITYSCVNKIGRGTIVPKQLVECRFDQAREYKLCTACRLFGAMGYMGQVSFSDAVQIEGGSQVIRIPPMYSPQRQIRGRRFYLHGQPATGGNVPVEVCPVGSRFRFEVRFENLTRGELGVLLIALGQGEPPLNPKLGGGKPACLGSARIEIESLAVRQPRRDFLHYDLSPPKESVEMSRCINTAYRARKLLFREGLEELAKILHYDEDEERECPAGAY